MSWKYKCVEELVAAIKAHQRTSGAINEFMRGFLKGSVVYAKLAANGFNVDREVRDSYQIDPECETIYTTHPTLLKCGVDVNLVPEQGGPSDIYFTPFNMGVGIHLCKEKCDKDSFTQKWNKKEYSAGVSFGKLFDQVFWFGVPELGEAGITQVAGTKLFDMSSSSKYSDLCAEAVTVNDVANWLNLLLENVEDPMICMGPRAWELIGKKAMSKTGDTCGEAWDCILKIVGNDRNTSVSNIRSLFNLNPMYDNITGIDPINPGNTDSVMHIIDKEYHSFGLENTETRNCAWDEKGDYGVSKRSMHMTGHHIEKVGANRFVYNFLDHAKVLECQGDRYASCGDQIGVTVPTPIVS